MVPYEAKVLARLITKCVWKTVDAFLSFHYGEGSWPNVCVPVCGESWVAQNHSDIEQLKVAKCLPQIL